MGLVIGHLPPNRMALAVSLGRADLLSLTGPKSCIISLIHRRGGWFRTALFLDTLEKRMLHLQVFRMRKTVICEAVLR